MLSTKELQKKKKRLNESLEFVHLHRYFLRGYIQLFTLPQFSYTQALGGAKNYTDFACLMGVTSYQ